MPADAATARKLGLAVDESKKYASGDSKGSAGRCDKCGFYKTWGTKIKNEKSGKDMPSHVTIEGFKIGNGDCPKYVLKNFTGPVTDGDGGGEGNGLDQAIDKSKQFTTTAGTGTSPMVSAVLDKLVTLMVRVNVDSEEYFVNFTGEEEAFLQARIARLSKQ